MKSKQPPLPIDPLLPEVLSALKEAPSIVLRAPAGAGKTTRVPPHLMGPEDRGRVILIQPRRLAARAAAKRIAEERGWRLGEEVGYHVRFDRRFGPRTRLLAVTEGLFLGRLQSDPFLQGVSAVVFDEFHERNLDADLALAMVRQVQREVRPDLKIVVMSATLETGPVAEYLGGCPVLESEGRLYPVEIRYGASGGGRLDLRGLPQRVAETAREALGTCGGDLLVFLPGVGEIRNLRRALQDLAERHKAALVPLYGDLPLDRQDLALRPSDRRKIVLATNVAETSVTVEGVEAVIDSGLARVLRFDPAVGLDRLELSRVSRASADQRSGRAGRQRPGVAWRLWSRHEQRGMAERNAPEIARIDLAGPVLQLLAWGEPDPAAFPWFEAPDPVRIRHALETLESLGAVQRGSLTPVGRIMARFPAQPRLARLMVEAARRGALEQAGLLAALIEGRSPFRSDSAPAPTRRSDYADPLEALERFESQCAGPGRGAALLDIGSARFALKVRRQLVDVARKTVPGKVRATRQGDEESLHKALLAAFPDRLARRRDPGSRRAVMTGGRGLVLSDESGVRDAELFLALEVSASNPGVHADLLVRKAVAMEKEWLPKSKLTASLEVEFDPDRERVVGRRRVRFRDLVIEEKEHPAPAAAAESALCEAAAARLDAALDLKRPELASWLNRVACLRDWMPDLQLPRFDEADLRDLLPTLAGGRRSFEELRKAPLLEILRGTLTHRQNQAIEKWAPERIEVPSGSRIKLLYEPGKPPVLAVRIQEIFGWSETPRLAAGRVPVLLHLLAPNHRPQQVTQDLAGFWKNTYPTVRKELRGRYPKHAWPEDPMKAQPTRRAKTRSPGSR